MKKISSNIAVLICLNTMVGGGVFINLKPLTQQMGALGFLSYLIAASLMLPLALCMASLAGLHPVTGGLYVYSKEYLGRLVGFVSGWGYFVGKTTSFALLIHKVVSFFHGQVPLLQVIPLHILDYAAIAFFVMINSVGVSIGGRVQYVITALKATPLLFALGCGMFIGQFDLLVAQPAVYLPDLFATIPIALYALTGFEVICGIGGLLENSTKTIARVIISAFGIATFVVVSFQIAMYKALGPELALTADPIGLLMQHIVPGFPMLKMMIGSIVFIAITGGAFSIMASNAWNMHALARDGHLPFARILMKVTTYQVPWVALLVEGVLACLVITLTCDQVPLQNMATMAMFITYLMTCLAAIAASWQGRLGRYLPVAICASLICCYVIGLCLNNVIVFGLSSSFLLIFLGGCGIALINQALRARLTI